MPFLEGLGLAGYRSFGPEMQYLGPLKKINIIIGKNNSGKSNILSFIASRLSQFKDKIDPQKSLPGMDAYYGVASTPMRVAIGMKLRGETRNDIAQLVPDGKHRSELVSGLDGVLTMPDVLLGDDCKWFEYKPDGDINAKLVIDSERYLHRLGRAKPLIDLAWLNLFQALQQGGNHRTGPTQVEILRAISPAVLEYPTPVILPAFRRIGEPRTSPPDFSGMGLIRRLYHLQNPTQQNYQEHKNQFRSINGFVQSVLEDSSATIEVPNDESDIYVSFGGNPRPLASLGTGIHQVIILAAAAVLTENSIVCIEEPELHLHPTLQRKLVRFLANTSNQYFISTHSAHLIDACECALFHVSYTGRSSEIRSINSSKEKFNACSDLGYRASDLVQANSIVWVEGPSDRIYLRHWISAMDSSLVEGVHYSIMFYGGALRAHLSALEAEDKTFDDFVSLLPLNRNMVMILDSDKQDETGTLSTAVVRLQRELESSSGYAWVTGGRTIENYVPHDVLQRAIMSAHPSVGHLNVFGQFDDALSATKNSGDVLRNPDKIRIAHEAVQLGIPLDQFDVKSQVQKLVGFIRSANGIR